MKPTKRKKAAAAAIVTINGPGRMSTKGRKAIAEWLRHTALDFELLGRQYTKGRFTARYLYR
jgi:hypothetical protein